MSRLHSEDKKKVRLYSERSHGHQISERKKEIAAIRRVAKEESVEYKIMDARSKCIQSLHHLEKEFKLAFKEKDSAKIEDARLKVLRGMDKAAADYMGRIMAEVKQTYLNKKEISKDEVLQVNLSVDDFYANFKKFCKRELKGFVVTAEDFDQITSWQLDRNISSLEKYGSSFGYDKPVEQFKENFEFLKDFVIKENELSL